MKKIQYMLSVLFLALIGVSCSQELELDGNHGYLTLKINSLVSTNNPGVRAAAPENYEAKTLHVEIQDSKGNVVKSTDDFANDNDFAGNIALKEGNYKVIAHSANWDGNGAGFGTPYYYGSTDVAVKAGELNKAYVTCTQANVKLTVNYDQTIVNAFKSAVTTITSKLSGIDALDFIMGKTTQSGYIPAGNFDAVLKITNNDNVVNTISRQITDVKPRDHYIFNYKLAQEGVLGDGTKPGVSVEVDESTNTYTFTFEVPTKSADASDVVMSAGSANAWSTFAILNASIKGATNTPTISWKKTTEDEWNQITNISVDASGNVNTTLKGLTPNTSYEYKLSYEGVESDVVTFTTEAQEALYNGGFEHWHKSGAAWYATESGKSYWDSSNPGSTSLGESYNVTTSTTSPLKSGTYAAKLESKYIVIKFAAASLYTGKFKELVGTKGAKLDWGVPFTSRPTALRGWMQYAPKAVNRVGKNLPAEAPAKGDMDQCGMFCALLTESIAIDNTDLSTIPDLNNDSRVVAYGVLPQSQNVDSNGQWKEVNIPLVYTSLTRKPTHLLVVFSSSKYGDYFHGGQGSTLYLDDFYLEYGDTPQVK